MDSVHESSLPRRSVSTMSRTRTASALLLSLATLTTGALTACSTEPPERDAMLDKLQRQLTDVNTRLVVEGDAQTPVFEEQAGLVEDEILRLCGTEDGEVPETCTTHTDVGVEDDPTIADIRSAMMALIGGEDVTIDDQEYTATDYPGAPGEDDARDRAVLLTGLHAALATFSTRESGGEAIDQELLDEGFSDSEETAEALSDAAELIHQAVYLSGAVLPASGENRGTVVVVGTRMRSLRDAIEPVAGVTAEPGYTTDVDITDRTAGTQGLLDAVHGVTVELRRAVDSVAAEDRAVTAMWCALAARSEAALEDLLGEDPSAVSIRGE